MTICTGCRSGSRRVSGNQSCLDQDTLIEQSVRLTYYYSTVSDSICINNLASYEVRNEDSYMYISDTSIVSSEEQPFLVGADLCFCKYLAVFYDQKPVTKNCGATYGLLAKITILSLTSRVR